MDTTDTIPTAYHIRPWSPAQAGYQAHTLAVTTSHPETPEIPGLVLHYQLTRHGAVARTWCGPDLVEVVLRRRGQVRGTYQGTVRAVAGGWQAHTPRGDLLGAVHTNYLDAEAPLLRERTGVVAAGTYRWPFTMLAVLNREIGHEGW